MQSTKENINWLWVVGGLVTGASYTVFQHCTLCSLTESSEEESDDEIAEKDSDVSGAFWSTAFILTGRKLFTGAFLCSFHQDDWDEDEEKDSEKDEGVDEDHGEEDEDAEDVEENGEDRDVSSDKELNGDSDLDPENESEEEWRQQPFTLWTLAHLAQRCRILPGRLAPCRETRGRHMLPSPQRPHHLPILSAPDFNCVNKSVSFKC